MVTQNYDFLQNIYKGFQTAVSEAAPGIDDTTRFLGHLSSAVFEKDKRKHHFELAKQHSIDMRTLTPPTQETVKLIPELGILLPTPISNILSQMSGEISLYIAELFETVLDIDTKGITQERLKRTKILCDILKDELSSIHPGNTFVLKTLCLVSLLQGNVPELEQSITSLRKCSGTEKKISSFVEQCRMGVSRERVKLKLAKSLKSDIDNRDPWNHLALLFVNAQMRSQLRRVNFSDYDALIFVEGHSDEAIFRKLAKRISPKLNLLIVGAQGWLSFQYFADSVVATRAHVPVMVIFDGDTSETRLQDIKERLIAALGPAPMTVTLKRNSIEDYLLVPRSIKSAAPSLSLDEKTIGLLLLKGKNKKNKKELLNQLLKQHADLKYNGEVGARIAENMRLSEIDPEIRDIFARLETLHS